MRSSWRNRGVQILVLALSLFDTAMAQTSARRRAGDPATAQARAADKAAVEARQAKLRQLLDSAEWIRGKPVGPGEQKARKTNLTADGFIRFLSLTDAARFDVQGQTPEQAADAFVNRWRSLLIGDSTASNLQYVRTVKRGPRSHVRYQQTFGNLRVYGAERAIVKCCG